MDAGARDVLEARRALDPFFHGTSAWLSALSHAERYEELLDLFGRDAIWHYKLWAVKALAAMGRTDEAIRYAEACRSPWTPDGAVNALCEETLLGAGRVEEAYARYGLWANRRNTSRSPTAAPRARWRVLGRDAGARRRFVGDRRRREPLPDFRRQRDVAADPPEKALQIR